MGGVDAEAGCERLFLKIRAVSGVHAAGRRSCN
jgi:hypothetical protein